MSTLRLLLAMVGIVVMACGCKSPDDAARAPYTTPYIGGPIPTNLLSFGNPTTNSIRVAVFGWVRRPGYYYLAQGAVVRDAIGAAHGLDSEHHAWWGYWSGLGRLKADGTPKVVCKFEDAQMDQDEQVPLRNGDWIHIGREVY